MMDKPLSNDWAGGHDMAREEQNKCKNKLTPTPEQFCHAGDLVSVLTRRRNLMRVVRREIAVA